MKKRMSLIPLALLLAMSLIATGCPPPVEPLEPVELVDPRYGGEIIVGFPADIKTLDPRLIVDVYSALVATQIGDPLVRLNERLEPIPALAESWYTPDPTTYIFNLRRGVKFHDGVEFTAADVKFTFETILDPDFGSPNRVHFLPVKEIEIIDDYTLKITLSEPMAPFLFQVMSMMEIVPKHYVEEIGAEDFAFAPIGTGPFKFVEWVPGDYVKLEAFEEHWRGRPYLDRVVFRVIPEATVRIMELEVGGIDYSVGVPPEEFARLEADPDIIAGKFPATAYAFLVPNLKHPILANKLVRQAISYAIDRETIIETILAGMASPATGPIPPTLVWAYTDDVRHYPYDPDKAKQLLAEAGYPDGFEISIMRGPGEVGVLTVTAIKEQLAKVGIEVELEILEFGVLLDRLFAFEYDIIHIGWTGVVDPDYGMYPLFKTDAGYNFNAYSNPEVDRLLEEGRMTIDLDTRRAIYHRLQEILAEELPHIFLTYPYTLFAYRSELEGFIHAPRRFGGPLNDLWRVWWRE
ncbi:ABC transporter substrate-binding protein [Dehalococcoidia bacterium]|nr:ABC transporter substrate-binding protein [Dehalococcoidia bacterium]